MTPDRPNRDRGSRKHILDILERNELSVTLARAFGGTEIRSSREPLPQPVNRGPQAAWREFDVETYLSAHSIPNWLGSLPRDWWLKGRGTRPTWDLICQIEVQDKHGLLLVEAKAHEGEFDWKGKRLPPSASVGSENNLAQISGCIQEANAALNRACDGPFNLSVGSHYQLANRMAYLWKLANLGLPVVLLYLGFLGDSYFASDYFRDDAHWQRAMGGYLQGVVVQRFAERVWTLDGGGSMQMLIRSLPVIEVSNR